MQDEISELREELFCTQFESKAFATYWGYGKQERWVPGFSIPSADASHLNRYILAAEFTAGKKVLDMACGCGKGTNYLAKEGKAISVDGLDLDSQAIRYAKHRYLNPNITFIEGDAMEYKKADFYDVIVSFETIEHLPTIDTYLKNIHDALKADGLFFVSTPISFKEHDLTPKNPYHIQEWGLERFRTEIASIFSIQEYYVQVYPVKDNRPVTRIINKVKSLIGRPVPVLPRFSKIYPYKKGATEYNESEFGRRQIGYQILVCRKKSTV